MRCRAMRSWANMGPPYLCSPTCQPQIGLLQAQHGAHVGLMLAYCGATMGFVWVEGGAWKEAKAGVDGGTGMLARTLLTQLHCLQAPRSGASAGLLERSVVSMDNIAVLLARTYAI